MAGLRRAVLVAASAVLHGAAGAGAILLAGSSSGPASPPVAVDLVESLLVVASGPDHAPVGAGPLAPSGRSGGRGGDPAGAGPAGEAPVAATRVPGLGGSAGPDPGKPALESAPALAMPPSGTDLPSSGEAAPLDRGSVADGTVEREDRTSRPAPGPSGSEATAGSRAELAAPLSSAVATSPAPPAAGPLPAPGQPGRSAPGDSASAAPAPAPTDSGHDLALLSGSGRGPGPGAEGGVPPPGARGGGGESGATSGSGGAGAPGAPGGAGAGDLAGGAEYGAYLNALRQRIQDSLRYPLAARRRGLAGIVELEVVLEPSGRIRSVRVLASSSHPMLDEAAVASISGMRPVPFPPDLPPRPVQVRVPLLFELR